MCSFLFLFLSFAVSNNTLKFHIELMSPNSHQEVLAHRCHKEASALRQKRKEKKRKERKERKKGRKQERKKHLHLNRLKAIAHSARLVYKNCKNSSFVQRIKNFNDVSWVDAVQLIHVHVVLLLSRTPGCDPLNFVN